MAKSKETDDCFVIMPMGEVESYDNDHFDRVYEDIIVPACEAVGYKAKLSSDDKKTSLIQLDILNGLLDAPMVVCDLSTRNPNVLFELGIRQAFDKPVVLIQEEGTKPIFDIAPLRYLEYSKNLKYRDVLGFQQDLSDAISSTMSSTQENGNISSIVKLLAINRSAELPDYGAEKIEGLENQLIRSELKEIRAALKALARSSAHSAKLRNYAPDDSVENYRNFQNSDAVIHRDSLLRALVERNLENSSEIPSNDIGHKIV